MTVYIPFDDGSSVAFNGESFTIQRSPVNENDIDININNSDNVCLAEKNWRDKKKRLKITRALEMAWNEQRELQKQAEIKQIYNFKK